MNIEDTMFMQALEVANIIIRKSIFTKADHTHKCELCTE